MKQMIQDEIFVLTHHAGFDAKYIENIPIYKRRYYLFLLQKENEQIEKLQEKAKTKSNVRLRK